MNSRTFSHPSQELRPSLLAVGRMIKNDLLGRSNLKGEQGQLTRGYLCLAGQLVGVVDFSDAHYQAYAVITDHLGTPRQLRDGNNTTVWQWQGEAFGNTPANEDPDGDGRLVTFNPRFPGQYFDRETGLAYNHFRY